MFLVESLDFALLTLATADIETVPLALTFAAFDMENVPSTFATASFLTSNVIGTALKGKNFALVKTD